VSTEKSVRYDEIINKLQDIRRNIFIKSDFEIIRGNIKAIRDNIINIFISKDIKGDLFDKIVGLDFKRDTAEKLRSKNKKNLDSLFDFLENEERDYDALWAYVGDLQRIVTAIFAEHPRILMEPRYTSCMNVDALPGTTISTGNSWSYSESHLEQIAHYR